MSNINSIISQINQLTGYNLPLSSGSLSILPPSGTIPTSGIYPGGIIKSEQILRIINALNGINEDVIIVSGSFLTSGSNVLDGTLSLPFIADGNYLFVTGGYVTGVAGISTPTASYAISSSYSLFAENALSASYFSGSISNAIFAEFAATASYFSGSISNAIYAQTASYLTPIGGGISAELSADPNSLFLIKSGSSTLFNIDNQGNVTTSGGILIDTSGSFSNLLSVKNNGTEYVKVNNEGVLVLHQYATAPTAVSGGMYFDTLGNFYLGL